MLPLLGAMAGGSFLSNLYQQFNPTARRYKRDQDALEKYRANAALENVLRQEEQAGEDQPYEQAQLRQGLAARRFGKSKDPMDIGNQAIGRLTRSQARQMAAIKSAKGEAYRGLSLIRQKRKYEKRMMPFQLLGMAQNSFSNLAPFMGGGKDK